MNVYSASPMQAGYGQQLSGRMNDEDMANILLGELKRLCREYTTAALESSNPAVRQTFEHLVQHTLRDQDHLFRAMSQMNMYGQPAPAQQQEVQKELQKQSRTMNQLQSLLQGMFAGAGGQQAYGQQHHTGGYPQSYGYSSQQTGGYGGMGQESYGQQRPSYMEPHARSSVGSQPSYETMSQQPDMPSSFQTRASFGGTAYGSSSMQPSSMGGASFDSSFPLHSSGSGLSGSSSHSSGSSFGAGSATGAASPSQSPSVTSASSASSAAASYHSASHGVEFASMDSGMAGKSQSGGSSAHESASERSRSRSGDSSGKSES